MLRYQLAHDADTLGRIEAANALGDEGDDESVAALKQCLFNDAFWGVRAAAATALGTIGNEATQTILLQALAELDAMQYSRVRSAIATALGQFAAPQQAMLAQRSAQALGDLLEKGDAASYVVESAAAGALGKTRAKGSVDQLLKVVDRPSWNHLVQRGIFSGLGAAGEDRVVDIIATYLTDTGQNPHMRIAAAIGMWTVGRNRHLYSEEARQRAVTALCYAVEHDVWDPIRIFSPVALLFFGEKRAIGVLDRAVVHELNTRAQRSMRVAAHVLRTDNVPDEQFKQLRSDLDLVREENRKLKEQLGVIEARLS
jgi:aminopeptidase N